MGQQFNNHTTGLPVWQLDEAGNTLQTGSVISGDGIVLTPTAAPPVPSAGGIRIFTPDGVSVQFQASTGTAVNQTVIGTLSLNGAGMNSTVLAAGVVGDANARYIINANGTMGWGPGTAGTDTNLYRAATAILQTDSSFQAGGNIAVETAGNGLRVKEGTNAKQGTAVLVAGAVVVANTSVTATSRIFLTSQADGGTPGFLRVSARTAGTSFTVTSSSAGDTSTVAFQIFEQA